MIDLSKTLSILTVLTLSAGVELGIVQHRAIAHQVQTSADIGGTVHVEPNDTPRAGEPTLAWFALTRRGGQSVPLSDCNCQLAIYESTQAEEAIATPALAPLSVEGYENVPSATITFPAVGAYELVMTGRPVVEGAFQPFELRFDVTVATVAPTASPAPTATASPSEDFSEATESSSEPAPQSQRRSSGVAIALIPLAILGFGWVVFKARRSPATQNDGDR